MCRFFDENLLALSEEGCWVADISSEVVVCACTHTTDFMAFVKSSYETLESSNYAVLMALAQMSASDIRNNVGLFVSLGFWGSYLLFTFIILFSDGCSPKPKLLKKYLLKLEASREEDSSDIPVDKTCD